MNRSPKRLASKLTVLPLILTGLIISLVVLPGLRRSAASSADSARTATARPSQQTTGTPLVNGVNASSRPLTLADFGVLRQPGRGGALLPAIRVKRAAAVLASPFAPNITATLADALQTDNNNSGKADPGDTLMYTATITNSGTDATGVTFTDDLSQNGGNLTLVPGSVNSSPVAVNDSYPNGVGNTRMTVNAANGVLMNDFDPDGTTPTAVPITNGNTTNGGKVTLLADGSFTYDPPVGFTGTDTFTYTATDGAKTDTGTVSITLTERVWYVNSAASVDGDGRSNTPFKVITGHLDGAGGAGDVDAANDYIFLFSGSYSVTTLPLESGQRLIGQGVNLVVNSQTLVTSSTKPTLTGSATAVTLSTGNTISGLDVTGTSGITGSSVGALTISTVAVVGNNGPAFDVQTAGAISVQLDSLSSTGAGTGMRLASPTSGTFTVTGTTTISKTSGTGDGITITGGGATTTFTGAVNVTTFNGKGIVCNAAGGITITSSSSSVDATGGAALDLTSQNLGSGWNFSLLKSTNSAAEGIKMQGCIQNLTATTTNIQTPTGNGIDIQSTVAPATLSFGTTTVNKTSAGTGINLVGNGTATVSFGALTLTEGSGSGLVAGTSGIVNVTSGTITATGGPSLNLSSVTAGITLTSASSTNSGTTGINLATVAGSVSIGTTTVTNPTGIGINATSSSATLSFGTTTANQSGGTGIVLGGSGVGNTGTITFGSISISPDSGQRGLLAQENTNTITATSGTISTTTGTALEITRSTSTTPLAISLTSVSATSPNPNGIKLTRTSGSFTITGDGTANNNGSGGTISASTSHAIVINTASNVSLNQMTITNPGATGIQVAPPGWVFGNDATLTGTGVNGFTLNRCTITDNAGNNSLDDGITIENGSGTISITNCVVTAARHQGITVDNLNQNMSSLTVQTNSVTQTPGGDGMLVQMRGASTLTTGLIGGASAGLGNTFSNNSATGLQISNSSSGGSNGNITLMTIQNNTLNANNAGIDCDLAQGASMTVKILNNTLTNHTSQVINLFNGDPSSSPSTMTATVDGNLIGTQGTIDSGTKNGNGIRVLLQSATAGAVTINNNQIRECPNASGIYVQATGHAAGNTVKVKVTNNTMPKPTGTAQSICGPANTVCPLSTVELLADTDSASETICALVTGNSAYDPTTFATGAGQAAYYLARRTGALLRIEGNTGQTVSQNILNNNTVTNQNTGAFIDENSNVQVVALGTCGGFPSFPSQETASASSEMTTESRAASSDASSSEDDVLRIPGIEKPGQRTIQGLTQAELNWMVQAALARWQQAGIAPEDLARLNQVSFEVAQLGNGELANRSGSYIRLDEKAAGFGWYFDPQPADDGEFQVEVAGRELQATEFSPAHDKMDLLSVIMREMAAVYTQGKDRLPKSERRNLRSLMQTTLSPGVRRLPLNQWNVTPFAPIGSTGSTTSDTSVGQATAPAQSEATPSSQPAIAQVEGQHAEASATPAEFASAARYAVFQRTTNQPLAAASLRRAVSRPQDVAVMGIHESVSETEDMPTLRPVAMMTQKKKAGGQQTFAPTAVQAGGIVSVGPFNLPAGESVTIMWSATIDTPVTPAGTTSVCTRGTVTASGGINVQTTDPGPPVVNGATCTTLAQADLAVTKSDTPDPVITGNNITYTINLINNGPDAAYNVKVTDATPTNTTFVSATPPAGWAVTSSPAVGGTGNIVFEKSPAGPVPNGGTAQFQVVVQVNANTAGGTIITNSAVATSDTPDGTQGNNTGTATTTAQAQADLAVTKSDAPDPVIAGNNITYTINFVNNGPGTAQTVTMTDAVPANTTFVSATVTTGTGWSTSNPAVGGTGNVVFSKASVPNAETAVFTIVVKVNSNTAQNQIITNSATAASTTSDPTPGNNTATATTTVNTQADLQVTKSDSPDPVTSGNNITYTINYTNAGPSDAQSVTVTDAVPANTTFVSATVTTGTGWSTSNPAVGGTGNVVFSKATSAVGETAVFTIVVHVGSNVASGVTISNSVTAATTTTDPTPGNDTASTTTTTQTAADLQVTKSDSPDPVTAGNNITYTINFSNNGPSDAQSVTVTDAVPANTTFVSAMVTTGTGWSASTAGPIVFSKATVAASETAVFTIVVKVNSGTANGATISNTATAASTTTDPTPGNNSSTATTTVQTSADIAITKSDSPDPSFAGNNITYTINFSNNGPSDAASVTVTDAVPANTTFVSATVTTGTGWSTSNPAVGGTGNVVFSKATVAGGETAVFTIVVKVDASTATGTIITNTATAATTTTDPNSANNTATATTTIQAQADLTLDKVASPTPNVVAGNNITYTLTLSNAGPGAAANVTVTDAVPANTTFVSATVTTGTGWSTSNPAVGGTGNVVFSKASVAVSETAVFTIVVHVNSNTGQNQTITNSATAASTTADPNPNDNTDATMTNVITQADLAVTKSDSPDPVFAGNNLTYTINLSNNGPSDAQSVTVTDAVPANTSLVSAVVTTGTGWSTNTSGPIVFSKATVAAGETAVFTIVVHVNSNTASGTVISNTATAATTTTDTSSGNDSSTTTTTVQTQADLAVTKTDSPDPVIAGNNLTYTINFSNAGPSDAQTVTVSDSVPANTSLVSAVVTTGTGWAVSTAGPILFSKATVVAGESAVFTIVVKVNANTANGTVISNTATTATTTTDPNSGNNSSTATTTVQTQADLAVTKTDTPDPSFAGSNITYTINFSNNGPSDAQTVTVTDAVPANTTFVSATVTTGTGWSTSNPAVGGTGNVVFSKATVTNGETAVFTVVVKVNANTANGATITNSAVAAATTGDGNSANNTGTATTSVITRADLAVTKTDSPDPVIAGNNLTYTINFSNNGPSDAQTVTVTDAVPANTTFVSATVTTGTGWSTSTAGPIVFSKATVAASETAVFTIVVKVNANTANGATISNTTTAATTTTDPTAGNNSATATTTVQTQADQAVTITDAPDPVLAGNNITYTINYVNNGPSDAQTVTVTNPMPANTTFVSATVTTGTGWSTTAPPVGGSAPVKGGKTTASNIVFSKSTVAAAETAVFTIVIKVNSSAANGSVITDTVTAASATTDPTAGNNSATATTTVQTQADLALTKTDSPDPVVASQNLTYTITLTNNGPSDAQTVSVSDTIPANTTFVSATVTTGTGWSTTAPAVGGTGTVTFTKATVAASETAVFTLVVNVNVNTPNNTVLSNTATVTTATTDPTAGNNSATATTTVIAQADLAVTKSDSPDPVCVGGNLTYTINFVDNGPGPGINTTVTDGVPANTTFVSATVTTGSGWSTSAPAVGGTGNVVFSKANVANGETAVFTIVVKVNAGVLHGTVITNTATAASSIPDPTPGNNSATATTTVDPIAPVITCPANITAVAQLTCPTSTTAVVNFTPQVSDNCSASYVCSPASGSAFPVGTTTVSCTATDTAGNTATCSFSVTVWSACLQDESNPGNVCLFDAQTGKYQFCCNGQVVATGTGTPTVRGCLISINHTKGDRKVQLNADLSQKRGEATIIIANQMTCHVTDTNMMNNNCMCPVPTP
jgi:uncharacterized repeat protein (TIGR01451 family)